MARVGSVILESPTYVLCAAGAGMVEHNRGAAEQLS